MKKTRTVLYILLILNLSCSSDNENPYVCANQLYNLTKDNRESFKLYTDSQRRLKSQLNSFFDEPDSIGIAKMQSLYYDKLISDYNSVLKMIEKDIRDSVNQKSATETLKLDYFMDYYHLQSGRINLLLGNNPEIKESVITLCEKYKQPIYNFYKELSTIRKKNDSIRLIFENKNLFQSRYEDQVIYIIPDSLTFFACLQCLLIQNE